MGRAIAIGNFDGVHRGHQAILAAAKDLSDSGTVIAVTFWPHPTVVLRPTQTPVLLCGISERVSLLKRAGADEVSIVEFTPILASWTPEQFVEKVLCSLNPTAVVVGQNFRFGVGAKADGHQMRAIAKGRFEVTVLPILYDEGRVSSSRIRSALVHGQVEQAAQMLGRWFRYSGIVVLGDQRGHALGFPTANITIPPEYACPADGVYAGYLTHGPNTWPAAISVGSNPTFDGIQRRVEAYAIDRADLKLYGEMVGVDFVSRLRGQMKFESKKDLVHQLRMDVAATRAKIRELANKS